MKTKSNAKKMEQKSTGITWKQLIKSIKEAQKNPKFIAEINRFIKVTTT